MSFELCLSSKGFECEVLINICSFLIHVIKSITELHPITSIEIKNKVPIKAALNIARAFLQTPEYQLTHTHLESHLTSEGMPWAPLAYYVKIIHDDMGVKAA